MRAEGVAVFDGGWETRADDGSAFGGCGGAPPQRVWFDAVLVGVCCEGEGCEWVMIRLG